MSEEKNVEGQGFVIRDKRQFNTEGESKPETDTPLEDTKADDKTETATDQSPQGESVPCLR